MHWTVEITGLEGCRSLSSACVLHCEFSDRVRCYIGGGLLHLGERVLGLEAFLARQLPFQFLNYALCGVCGKLIMKEKKTAYFLCRRGLGKTEGQIPACFPHSMWISFSWRTKLQQELQLRKKNCNTILYLQCWEVCLVQFITTMKTIVLADWGHRESSEEDANNDVPIQSFQAT